MALQSFVGHWPLFSFLIFYTVGRTPRTRDQPVARSLLAHRINAQRHLFKLGFEPTIPVFVRAEIFHVLDRAATVIGLHFNSGRRKYESELLTGDGVRRYNGECDVRCSEINTLSFHLTPPSETTLISKQNVHTRFRVYRI
jgi:hypothetical protein